MAWYRIAAGAILAVALLAPASAQSGPQVFVTVIVMGAVQDQGGAYYVAFSVNDSLLAGPQPDSTNWTHYVVYRGGRFQFGTVPPTATEPFSFVAIRPPVPFLYGQVMPDRKALRASVPLADLRTGPALPRRFMVNFVTVDDTFRPLHALGLGVHDRFGFVTVDATRALFYTVPAPRGPRPDPNFAIAGGEIRLSTP